MKNHHLDLVRVTEAGAIAAANWVGRGNKEEADKAATGAMTDRLNKIDFSAEISIGEGKKDKSFGLFKGDNVGKNVKKDSLFEYSIAIDPIEGTTPTSVGGYEAMSVIALANHNCFFDTEEHYMYKLAVRPSLVSPEMKANNSITSVVKLASLIKPMNRITVCMLDRPRHTGMIEELRACGCRIKLIQDCDVTACIATCTPDSSIDIYVGVGGSPEAVIAAAAMKCMGGWFQTMIGDKDGNKVGDKVYEIED